MAVVQSTYSERISLAVNGMVADEYPHAIETRIVEPTSGIPFGRAVSQGTNDRGAVLAGGTLANFVGVSVRDVTLAPVSADSAYLDEYTYKSNMAVLQHGRIWVTVKDAVVAGTGPTYDATTGQFGDTGGTGPVPGAVWVTTQATIGGLALLQLSGRQRT